MQFSSVTGKIRFTLMRISYLCYFIKSKITLSVEKKKRTPIFGSPFWWAIRDSNPGPTGYEPVALTN